jgi:predicted transcriptional regulator
METGGPDDAARLAADVLIAFLGRNDIQADALPDLARRLTEAFAVSSPTRFGGPAKAELASPSAADAPADIAGPMAVPERRVGQTPAVRVEDSIHDDYLVSLEDGRQYRTLRRHLMAKYGMTPEAYRAKWGLPADYPMVAPSYARERSEVAKRSGLGHSPADRRPSGERAV